MQEVVRKILLKDTTLVPQTNDEFIHSACRIKARDVPTNSLAPDLNHCFRSNEGILRKPNSKTPAKITAFIVAPRLHKERESSALR